MGPPATAPTPAPPAGLAPSRRKKKDLSGFQQAWQELEARVHALEAKGCPLPPPTATATARRAAAPAAAAAAPAPEQQGEAKQAVAGAAVVQAPATKQPAFCLPPLVAAAPTPAAVRAEAKEELAPPATQAKATVATTGSMGFGFGVVSGSGGFGFGGGGKPAAAAGSIFGLPSQLGACSSPSTAAAAPLAGSSSSSSGDGDGGNLSPLNLDKVLQIRVLASNPSLMSSGRGWSLDFGTEDAATAPR